ncbi:hypothetical protein PInf_019386 [Phytophthora infestans]|nr:hypothetical protein PInf_019386 [Phytophthora infestans]
MEQQQQQIPATATSLTSAARGIHVMNEVLRPWALYDISGAQDPESLDEMKDLFRRFRALRQKPVDGVDHSALQESWCAFIRRWNRTQAQEENLVDWIAYREEIIGGHSLGELRVRICDSAWNADDRICYVRVAEGCRRCVSSRPTTDEWRAHVAEHPLSDRENAWIQRYRRSLSENASAASRAGSRRHSSRRSASPPLRWDYENSGRRSRSRSRDRQQRRSRSRSRGRATGGHMALPRPTGRVFMIDNLLDYPADLAS